MREIYYALFRSASIDVLLYTVLAEAIAKDWAGRSAERLQITAHGELLRAERVILERVRFGSRSQLRRKHIAALVASLTQACLRQGYCRRWPLVGIRLSRKLRRDVAAQFATLNAHIVDYIDSGELAHLRPILARIEQVQFPTFQPMRPAGFGRYRDMLEMQRVATAQSIGLEPNNDRR